MATNEELKNMGFDDDQITSLNYIEIHKCVKCGRVGIGKSGFNAMELVNMTYNETKNEYCHKECLTVI
jgi:hypothetical protein